MAKPRKPTSARHPLIARQQIAGLTNLLGGHTLLALSLGTLLLVSLAWFADTVYLWLLDLENSSLSLLQKTLGLGLFPALTLFLYIPVRHWVRHSETDVQVFEDPVPARGMVGFLSPIHAVKKQEELRQIIDENKGNTTALWQRLDEAQIPWQMPLKALSHHASRLESVIFLTSRDTEKGPGSARQLDLFRELVAAYPPTAHLPIQGYGELTADARGGIDPGDVKRIHHAFQEAHATLCRQFKAKSYEVVADVTGGMATATMAGVMFALGEGLVCQYVDTRDHKVQTYDLEYARPQA